MNNSITTHIPAKALLFGEYGVLYGGRAIAVSFFDYSFLLSLSYHLTSRKKFSAIIHGEGFTGNFLELSDEDLTLVEDAPQIARQAFDKHRYFFSALLSPWKKHLASYEVEILIHKAFSSSLGFGSSSALIAGVSKSLATFFAEEMSAWQKAKTSLLRIQGGRGSGYDVAVQMTALQTDADSPRLSPSLPSTKFWVFEPQDSGNMVEVQELIPHENSQTYGCFISTGKYSDTAACLKDFSSQPHHHEYAKQHALLAEKFLSHSTFSATATLMQESLNIAQKQGILPPGQQAQILLDKLIRNKIPFKTMGAGHGDCLWVLANSQTLLQEHIIHPQDIKYAFENQRGF